jgi:tetrahydromethanopterin S-methyltransferase subunit F
MLRGPADRNMVDHIRDQNGLAGRRQKLTLDNATIRLKYQHS